MARGLLSRLGRVSGRRTQSKNDLDDIVEHLRVLLNTRQGESLTVPEFGVPEFSDLVHNFPSSINLLRQAIATTITRFEPRLTRVVVRHRPDDDPLVLKYEITAVLADPHEHGTLKLQTQMTPGGKVDIFE
jgi:type VI secretion system protein